jgi:uncharacterized membrane protein YoaK (UPF0700 family)
VKRSPAFACVAPLLRFVVPPSATFAAQFFYYLFDLMSMKHLMGKAYGCTVSTGTLTSLSGALLRFAAVPCHN